MALKDIKAIISAQRQNDRRCGVSDIARHMSRRYKLDGKLKQSVERAVKGLLDSNGIKLGRPVPAERPTADLWVEVYEIKNEKRNPREICDLIELADLVLTSYRLSFLGDMAPAERLEMHGKTLDYFFGFLEQVEARFGEAVARKALLSFMLLTFRSVQRPTMASETPDLVPLCKRLLGEHADEIINVYENRKGFLGVLRRLNLVPKGIPEPELRRKLGFPAIRKSVLVRGTAS